MPGPKPTDSGLLRLRGSKRAGARHPRQNGTIRTADVPGAWEPVESLTADQSAAVRALLEPGLLPGFDPSRDAAGCEFDPVAAHNAVAYFPSQLRLVKGAEAGKPFVLQPWQAAIVANLFGWKRADGTRRFREVWVYVPKKNGKTAFAAGILVYVLDQDGEAGAEVYSAASSRDQAGLVFGHAAGMVKRNPRLNDLFRCFGLRGGSQMKAIVDEETMSAYRALAADANTADGTNVHMAIIDEVHRHKSRELSDVLSRSTAARTQPIMLYVTTADHDRESLCNEKLNYARQVLKGAIEDPAFLPVVYETSRDADWQDPAVWRKANPNLGVTVGLEFLEHEAKRAADSPVNLNSFKRLHLNIVTEQIETWLPMDQWDRCAGPGPDDPEVWRAEQLARLKGKQCWGGLDLGSTSDLSALVLLFPEDGGRYTLLPWFWMPHDGIEGKDPKFADLYRAWIAQGFVTATPGNVCDYDVLRRDVGALADTFGIVDLAVDRLFQGADLCTRLMGDGMNLVAFGQGFLSMAAPAKRFAELVASGAFQHGRNPVLRWMASNAAVKQDESGNIKPVKPLKRDLKIDGIVASIMALGRRMATGDATSVYASRGVMVL